MDWTCGVPFAACVSVRTMARRASSILKALCAKPLASRSSSVGGLREGGRAGGLSAQRGFGLGIAPRLVRDAAERETRLLDACRRRVRAPAATETSANA